MNKITPHKGGRDTRLYLRVTSDAKANLKRVAKQFNITQADVIDALLQDTDALIDYVDKLTDYGRNDPTED